MQIVAEYKNKGLMGRMRMSVMDKMGVLVVVSRG